VIDITRKPLAPEPRVLAQPSRVARFPRLRPGLGLLAVLALAAACRPLSCPPQTFQRVTVDAHPPGGPECCTDVMAVGDINGDGRPDLVVGGEGDTGSGLVWYENPGWRKHPVGKGEFTTDAAVADMDGDGDLDIVVGELMRGVLCFEQAADGRWIEHVVGEGGAHDLLVVDVDADGRPDVIATDKQGVTLFASQGGFSFRASRLLERPGEGLAAADLDGDGDVDLLYSNLWLKNEADSSGRKWIPQVLAPDWPADTRIQVADMDSDGRDDVVLAASEGAHGLAWFSKPAGAAEWPWTRHWIETRRLTGTHSLRVADVNADGRPDVLAAEMHTSPSKRVLLFLQTSDGWGRIRLATHGSHNMVAADFDRDGRIDFAGKNYAGADRAIEIWRNRLSLKR
jgi:hypothetical protein